MILGISYLKGHSIIAIFGALFLIGFFYTLIDNVSKRSNSGDKLLDSSGNPININPINPKFVRNIFYVFIYAAPLLFGQVGGGVTRITFETMGIRQEGVTIHIEAKEYKSILESYKNEGLISGLVCNEVCSIQQATILFTNIGANTKIELKGKEGALFLVLPTKIIKLTAQSEPNKSSKADARKRAVS